MHNGQTNAGGGQAGQDQILKSSSDVKVGQFVLMNLQKIELKANENNKCRVYFHKLLGINLL